MLRRINDSIAGKIFVFFCIGVGGFTIGGWIARGIVFVSECAANGG